MKYAIVRMPVEKIVFILFSMLLFQSLAAQDTIQRKSIITLNVFSPLASQAPRWDIGYIRNISKRVWLGVELGYGNYDITINDVSGRDMLNNDYKIFEIRPSVYYDLRPSGRLKHLVSAELFFINHTDTFERGEYYDTEVLKTYRYDAADYKRLKYGFNLNYNLMYNFGSRFALMQTIGIGLKIRDVDFTNFINKVDTDRTDDDEGLGYGLFFNNYYRTDDGFVTAFNFNLDLKLIYRFK